MSVPVSFVVADSLPPPACLFLTTRKLQTQQYPLPLFYENIFQAVPMSQERDEGQGRRGIGRVEDKGEEAQIRREEGGNRRGKRGGCEEDRGERERTGGEKRGIGSCVCGMWRKGEEAKGETTMTNADQGASPSEDLGGRAVEAGAFVKPCAEGCKHYRRKCEIKSPCCGR
eukprot:766469-Hanusia_phi.AAC.3